MSLKVPESIVFHFLFELEMKTYEFARNILGRHRETFQVSDGRIYSCCVKDDVSLVVDTRGHKNPGNKVDTSDVVNHIKSFPSYVSHYTRAHSPNRRYLNSDLTVKKMYDLYVAWCGENDKIPVKEKMYYHVFSTQFNLHFKPPLKDTCQFCDSQNNKLASASEQEKVAIEREKELHLRKAEKARECLKQDKEKCSDDYFVFTFDLQKALAFPKLTTSTAYYKRNLYVYNFGCHVFNTNKAFMYVWPETEGSRGSQEIAACLVNHITTHAKGAKHIVTYSDCCTGQNRNIKLVLSLMKYLQKKETKTEIINMKFLVSGHSYLPNDSDFSFIEKRAKNTSNIFSPRDWYNIILECRKSNKYSLTEMNHEHFFSTKNLQEAITNRKKTEKGDSVNWLKMRWIRLEKKEPFTIKFKFTNSDEMDFECINIQKKVKGRPMSTLANVEQALLYPEARAISLAKKKDMMELLKFIPPIHHDYYMSLKTERGSSCKPTEDEDEQSFFYID